jgi:hypothetical protein
MNTLITAQTENDLRTKAEESESHSLVRSFLALSATAEVPPQLPLSLYIRH